MDEWMDAAATEIWTVGCGPESSPSISNVQFWVPTKMCEFCWLIAFLCRIIADFFHTFAHIIEAGWTGLYRTGQEGTDLGGTKHVCPWTRRINQWGLPQSPEIYAWLHF